MKEVVARISSENDYVEIAYKENEDEIIFKKIDACQYVRLVSDTIKQNGARAVKNIRLLDPQVIAMDENYVVIKQPGSKKIVTYNAGDKIKTYRINFPNSIYIIEVDDSKIKKIECYAYKRYAAEKTALYEYPMPNELTQNYMCIGTADRSVRDGNILEALEKIIFTPYSHSTFSGMNGFSNTEMYFQYLEENEFPYKFMKPLKKELKDVLKD